MDDTETITLTMDDMGLLKCALECFEADQLRSIEKGIRDNLKDRWSVGDVTPHVRGAMVGIEAAKVLYRTLTAKQNMIYDRKKERRLRGETSG